MTIRIPGGGGGHTCEIIRTWLFECVELLMYEGFVDTEVARFHYSRTGDGPPLLLIRGGGGWRFNFQAMIPVLAQRHTVYALDPPGQGLTDIV